MPKPIVFARRMETITPSFIREILKAANDPGIISFAGGLPNKDFFPDQALAEISARLMRDQAEQMLQYGQTEGELVLRETIAERYHRLQGIEVSPDNILITNGSQQALDLIGKVLLNPADSVVIESPGYLGAIQSLLFYQPDFLPVAIDYYGMDLAMLAGAMTQSPKLIYTVPNFQNPTGFSYEDENRQAVARHVVDRNTYLIEDDPYGEIRFEGEARSSFFHYLPEQTLLLGSASKIIAPGLRVGWVVAPTSIMQKLVIAKQAADLHSSRLSQHTIYEYLRDRRYETHINDLCRAYQSRCHRLGDCLDHHFGEQIRRSHPQGGMFMWVDFPATVDTMKLFEIALSKGVVFVPAQPFYTDSNSRHAARLNFSCSSLQQIESGIQKLYLAFTEYQT